MSKNIPLVNDNPTWFIDRFTLYQNANSDPESIKRNFLIRIAEFELIVADLRNKKKGDPAQHELILGRRGSGKSTLLRRIQIEIDEQPDLSEKYVAINLAEEQNSIYRLSDLWFEVLEELGIRFKKDLNLRAFDSFDDNQSYTRYLFEHIHEILQESGKRAVLLLDNLDRILENFDDDAHLLRETLLNYQDIQIIGGSTRMNEHFWKYDKPFYDFFRRHRLEGLSFEEIHQLLNHWSAEMDLPKLHDYALTHRGRIEAIRILTDGLPRALQYFIQVLLHDSDLYGFDYLKKVMDKATPLYQERLNSLTPPQRKIVQEMAFIWEAAPTKTLVEKCRMESKLIASFLRQLDQFGIVETLATGKKNHLYRLSERFFNTWLIVTQGNPDQKRRAKYLTLFLEAWYDEQELRDLTRQHLADLQGKRLSFDKAMVLSKGLSQSRYINTLDRDALINYTLTLKPDHIKDCELPRTATEIFKEITLLFESRKYDEVLEKLTEIENEEDGLKFFMEALCLECLKNLKEAERLYLLAIEKGIVQALISLALLYAEQGKIKKAETYFLRAIEKGDVDALGALANLYAEQGKQKDAETYYLQAIEKGDANALYNLTGLYFSLNIHPRQALEFITQYMEKIQDESKLSNLLVVEIWNGRFEKVPEKIERVIQNSNGEGLNFFLLNLLNLSQIQLVLSLFESKQHSKMLRQRYELLFYATLILAGRTEDNLLLRIPSEVLPTVEDIVAKVRENQAFYTKK